MRAQAAKVWSFQTGAGNRGSPISYSVNSRQYVATPTGWQGSLVGGAARRFRPASNFAWIQRWFVFALPQ